MLYTLSVGVVTTRRVKMNTPRWFKTAVITTGGKRYDGKAYAADKDTARIFAASWASSNGLKVGVIKVSIQGE